MLIPATFHAAAVVEDKGTRQFHAELQVLINDSVVTIWNDTYFDPVTALQALTKQTIEALNG